MAETQPRTTEEAAPRPLPPRILESPNPPSRDAGTVYFETERLIVRRYVAADTDALAAISDFRDIWNAVTDRFPSPYTLADAKEFLKDVDNQHAAGYPTQAAILVKPQTADNPSSEPRLIGGMGAEPMDNVFYRTWDMGYYLTPSAWGKGYMTEALAAFARYMFATWPRLHRLEAQAFAFNPSSAKVLQKVGFKFEGVRVGAAEKNGQLTDVQMFGMLREHVGGSSAG